MVGLLILAVTARWLGPEGRGVVAVVSTWSAVLATCFSLSLGQVALRRVSGLAGSEALTVMLGPLLMFAGVTSAFAWIFMSAWRGLVGPGSFGGLALTALMLGALAIPLLVWEEYGGALLMAIGKLRTHNQIQVLGRSCALLFVVGALWIIDGDAIMVLIATLLGQAIATVSSLHTLLAETRARGRQLEIRGGEISRLVAGGLKLHLNAIGTILFSSAGILVLHHYRGPAETAQYQLAVQLVTALIVLPQAISSVFYEKMSLLGPDRAWHMQWKVMLYAVGAMSILLTSAGVTAPLWLVAIAGNQFVPAIEVFQWLLLGALGMTVSALMAPQWIGRGYFLAASGITLATGLLSIMLCLWLVPELGMQGAIVAFIAAQLMSLFANCAMAWHCELCARRSGSYQ